MRRLRSNCPYELVHEIQFRHLSGDIEELKQRVRSLESTLARGVVLLVANLAGVVMSLAQQLLKT
ncbi:MAG: hypothetical protein HY706_03220 [Candidatus Hydrogenedentes bacterium]|nr:hypothetical protein [Candidatus Hydrogenedentota bacterium]